MPTTAETYRKTYAERHLERLRANYERAVEEWERGAVIDEREADWIEEQIKAQHDYVYRLKKAGIKSGDVADAMDIVKAEDILVKRRDDNIDNRRAAKKDASSMFEAPSNIMSDLFSISPMIQEEVDANLTDPSGTTALNIIKQHLRSKGVATTVGSLSDGQRMAAAIEFEAELNRLTHGVMPDMIKGLLSDQFAVPPDLIDAKRLKRLKDQEIKKALSTASAPLGNLAAAVGSLRDQGAKPMDAVRAVDPQLKKAEDDLAALVERREALDSGREAPTEEELRARAVELTGPMLSRKARRERRRRTGPTDKQKIISANLARARSYILENPDPDSDTSDASEIAHRIHAMIGSGALDKRDMISKAAELAGDDMGYRDDIIMRVFAQNMARTRRKAYRDIPEQVGQEGPEFQAVDMEKLASTVEEVAPEQ